MMQSILGIDAAWTETQPSGVALIYSQDHQCRYRAVAPSYETFVALAEGQDVDWSVPSIRGRAPDVEEVLEAARSLTGKAVDVVAFDMPLSKQRITGRRDADRLVSEKFGGRNCSTHSPTWSRPGPLGEKLRAAFDSTRYPLVTVGCTLPALIEVYPHTALLSLLKCKERFKYKISKARKFFKSGDPIAGLLEAFQTIHSGLSREIADLPPFLPARDDVKSVASLKRYEDALDALICAWVGTLFVNTKAIPLGDGNAAIWCPEDVT